MLCYIVYNGTLFMLAVFLRDLLDEIPPESRRELRNVQVFVLHQLLDAEPLQRQLEVQNKPGPFHVHYSYITTMAFRIVSERTESWVSNLSKPAITKFSRTNGTERIASPPSSFIDIEAEELL